jgi:hypothetical protein
MPRPTSPSPRLSGALSTSDVRSIWRSPFQRPSFGGPQRCKLQGRPVQLPGHVETVRRSAFVDYIRSAQDPQDGGFTLTLETIPQADWDFMESPSQLLPKHIGHERTTVALILSHCGRFGHGSRSSQVLEPRCIVYIPAKICEGDVRRRFVLRVSSVLERLGMIGFGSSPRCMSCTLLSRLAVTPQILLSLKYVDIHLMSDRVTVCGRELSRPGRSVGSWEARNLAGRWLGVTLHNALRRPNPSRKRAGG